MNEHPIILSIQRFHVLFAEGSMIKRLSEGISVQGTFRRTFIYFCFEDLPVEIKIDQDGMSTLAIEKSEKIT